MGILWVPSHQPDMLDTNTCPPSHTIVCGDTVDVDKRIGKEREALAKEMRGDEGSVRSGLKRPAVMMRVNRYGQPNDAMKVDVE